MGWPATPRKRERLSFIGHNRRKGITACITLCDGGHILATPSANARPIGGEGDLALMDLGV